MRITDQVAVEIVQVRALDPAPVTPPGVVITVEPLVQEIQSLIGEGDVAVLTLPIGVTVVVVLCPVVVDFLDYFHRAGRCNSFPVDDTWHFRQLLLASDAQIFGLLLLV